MSDKKANKLISIFSPIYRAENIVDELVLCIKEM
jgi:hypothetical protein